MTYDQQGQVFRLIASAAVNVARGIVVEVFAASCTPVVLFRLTGPELPISAFEAVLPDQVIQEILKQQTVTTKLKRIVHHQFLLGLA